LQRSSGTRFDAGNVAPVATPANLMVMEPGGYGFGDYWKLGLPLLALFGADAVLLVPVCSGDSEQCATGCL
jgi:di/tricarboxylate transporter